MQSCCRSLHLTATKPQGITSVKSPSPVNVAAAARPCARPVQQPQLTPASPFQQQKSGNGRAATAVASLGRRAVLGSIGPCFCCACRPNRISWYDSYFAFNMAHGMQEYEEAIAPLKKALFNKLFVDASISISSSSSSSSAFSLLEVGIGAGPNFAYYPTAQQQQQLSITGLEPNPAMWQYARQGAAAAGLTPQQLQLVAADAQQMPFEQESFDAAVITLVLCSLPNPGEALSEVLRVLKPGGKLLLIEHVISPKFGWIQVQQRLLDPLQQLLADNCHLTRDTSAVLQRGGFEGETLQPYCVDGVAAAAGEVAKGGLLSFEVEGMGLIGPHIAGILSKPTLLA